MQPPGREIKILGAKLKAGVSYKCSPRGETAHQRAKTRHILLDGEGCGV